MPYSPTPYLGGRIQGTSSVWADIIDNHTQVQDDWTPPIIDMARVMTQTSTTAADRLIFKVRRNDALHDIRFRIRAAATTGSGVITCYSDANSTAQAITGAAAWYNVDVTPTSGDSTCKVAMDVDAPGDSITLYAIQVGLLPATGTEPDWVQVDTRWATATDAAVPSRVCTDLRNGPAYLARDRLVCAAYHCADLQQTITGKTPEAWGAENTDEWVRVGRLLLPRVDDAVRTWRLDAYGSASGSATFRVAIGATTWQWTTAGSMQTTTVQLGPGPHDVYASVLPGSSDEAAIRTLQLWRGDT